MLGLSALIGVYFGFCGKKEDTPKEYLMGGKSMSTLPVAVSLWWLMILVCFSTISGITVMGVPSEIYMYGTLYWLICLCGPIVALINNYVYLPVFYELQLTSVYEYLELRFNQSVRMMASILCTVALLLYVPIVIYVPALALSQVSGMNLHYITPITSIICIFYTMLGGIKAVVWTDFLQGVVMGLSTIAVIILGVIHVGGFANIWERNEDGGRIRFLETNPSVFERMSIWSIVIGGISGWLGGLAVNQAMVQRFLSLSSYTKVRK
ncbi:Sodium-coupled monocarboxylate transporter 1 [Blattella germanica]|nr:Sodium-coupled monocarboxylate transporter 1 [Blattella germanica]